MTSSPITFNVSDTHPTPENFIFLADEDACSPEILLKYGGDIGNVKLRVYPDFVVVVMGRENGTYKHVGKLNCDVLRNSGELVYCGLTGDDDGRLHLSVSDKRVPRDGQTDDRKCLFQADFDIFNVWEGSWYVQMYTPEAKDGTCKWDVHVTELVMTSTNINMITNGTVCANWPIRNPTADGFLALDANGWKISFDIRFEDFCHIGFCVSRLNTYLDPWVEMRLIRKI
jgi:hypothetical protein